MSRLTPTFHFDNYVNNISNQRDAADSAGSTHMQLQVNKFVIDQLATPEMFPFVESAAGNTFVRPPIAVEQNETALLQAFSTAHTDFCNKNNFYERKNILLLERSHRSFPLQTAAAAESNKLFPVKLDEAALQQTRVVTLDLLKAAPLKYNIESETNKFPISNNPITKFPTARQALVFTCTEQCAPTVEEAQRKYLQSMPPACRVNRTRSLLPHRSQSQQQQQPQFPLRRSKDANIIHFPNQSKQIEMIRNFSNSPNDALQNLALAKGTHSAQCAKFSIDNTNANANVNALRATAPTTMTQSEEATAKYKYGHEREIQVQREQVQMENENSASMRRAPRKSNNGCVEQQQQNFDDAIHAENVAINNSAEEPSGGADIIRAAALFGRNRNIKDAQPAMPTPTPASSSLDFERAGQQVAPPLQTTLAALPSALNTIANSDTDLSRQPHPAARSDVRDTSSLAVVLAVAGINVTPETCPSPAALLPNLELLPDFNSSSEQVPSNAVQCAGLIETCALIVSVAGDRLNDSSDCQETEISVSVPSVEVTEMTITKLVEDCVEEEEESVQLSAPSSPPAVSANIDDSFEEIMKYEMKSAKGGLTPTINSVRSPLKHELSLPSVVRSATSVALSSGYGALSVDLSKRYSSKVGELRGVADVVSRSASVDNLDRLLPVRTRLRRQARMQAQSSEDQPEDPIERLNRLRARISGALSEVKGVLKQYSTETEENAGTGQALPAASSARNLEESAKKSEEPVQFRFVRKVRRRSIFNEEDEDRERATKAAEASKLEALAAIKEVIPKQQIEHKNEKHLQQQENQAQQLAVFNKTQGGISAVNEAKAAQKAASSVKMVQAEQSKLTTITKIEASAAVELAKASHGASKTAQKAERKMSQGASELPVESISPPAETVPKTETEKLTKTSVTSKKIAEEAKHKISHGASEQPDKCTPPTKAVAKAETKPVGHHSALPKAASLPVKTELETAKTAETRKQLAAAAKSAKSVAVPQIEVKNATAANLEQQKLAISLKTVTEQGQPLSRKTLKNATVDSGSTEAVKEHAPAAAAKCKKKICLKTKEGVRRASIAAVEPSKIVPPVQATIALDIKTQRRPSDSEAVLKKKTMPIIKMPNAAEGEMTRKIKVINKVKRPSLKGAKATIETKASDKAAATTTLVRSGATITAANNSQKDAAPLATATTKDALPTTNQLPTQLLINDAPLTIAAAATTIASATEAVTAAATTAKSETTKDSGAATKSDARVAAMVATSASPLRASEQSGQANTTATSELADEAVAAPTSVHAIKTDTTTKTKETPAKPRSEVCPAKTQSLAASPTQTQAVQQNASQPSEAVVGVSTPVGALIKPIHQEIRPADALHKGAPAAQTSGQQVASVNGVANAQSKVVISAAVVSSTSSAEKSLSSVKTTTLTSSTASAVAQPDSTGATKASSAPSVPNSATSTTASRTSAAVTTATATDTTTHDNMPERQVGLAPVQAVQLDVQPEVSPPFNVPKDEFSKKKIIYKKIVRQNSLEKAATKLKKISAQISHDEAAAITAPTNEPHTEILESAEEPKELQEIVVCEETPALPKRPPRKVKKKVIIRRQQRRLSASDTTFFNEITDELPLSDIETLEKAIEYVTDDDEDDVDALQAHDLETPPKPLKTCMRLREYQIGDWVMYAERFRKTQVRWKKGRVLDRITSISYKLDVEGKEVPAHISYIKQYTDRRVNFGSKEYLEIDYEQIAQVEQQARSYSIWNMV